MSVIKAKHSLKQIISQEEIQNAVVSIANDLNMKYGETNPLVIFIEDGARRFYYDLFKYFQFFPYNLCASYKTYAGTNRQKGAVVKEIDMLTAASRDKEIILIDDIIDSGHTLDYFIKLCEGAGCKSVETCVLLNKESKRETAYSPDYSGFIVDDVFVVGYGMDYCDEYRDLDFIAELKIDENC